MNQQRMVPRGMPQRPQQPTPVVGAFRDVNITPIGWHLPPRGMAGPYVDVVYDCFPDLVEFTLGHSRVSVKLQCFEGEPKERVMARCLLATGRLFALWMSDSREAALDGGSLESERAKTIAMIDPAWLPTLGDE